MEKITISSLRDSCTPMNYKEWTSKTKQMALGLNRQDLLKYIFPHLHAEFALVPLQMTKYQMQTKFPSSQKVTYSCFVITSAFREWILQGGENITIWTCSLTSTQRTSQETFRRDGKSTIRYSVSLTTCADDLGERWWVVIYGKSQNHWLKPRDIQNVHHTLTGLNLFDGFSNCHGKHCSKIKRNSQFAVDDISIFFLVNLRD